MVDSDLGPEEYLLYQVIQKNHDIGGDLPKTQFHKLSFLVYKEFEDQGIQLDLPVYWYEHGIMVDIDELAHFFFSFERGDYTRVGKRVVLEDDEIDPTDFSVPDWLRTKIDDVAASLARRFGNVYDTSVAKDGLTRSLLTTISSST